jgi:hypothetical protein
LSLERAKKGGAVVPRVCPRPDRFGGVDFDCPLYEQRVVNTPGESLRRAILTERHTAPDLAALIRAEHRSADPVPPALPSGPMPVVQSILKRMEGETR